MLPEGREYCARYTIYIGKDGKVLEIDREVHPASAGSDVAAKLEALGIAKKS